MQTFSQSSCRQAATVGRCPSVICRLPFRITLVTCFITIPSTARTSSLALLLVCFIIGVMYVLGTARNWRRARPTGRTVQGGQI